MNASVFDSLATLAQLSLRGCATPSDRLAVYDSVELVACAVASSLNEQDTDRGAFATLYRMAGGAAADIRKADQAQLNFDKFLGGGDRQ